MSPSGQQQLRFLGAAQNRRSQPIPSQEWERHREQLLKMRYEMSVKEISTVMERDHGFIATKDQYNNQFKKWKWSKHGVPANNSSNRGRKNASVTVVHQDKRYTPPAVRYTSTPVSSSPSSSSSPSPPLAPAPLPLSPASPSSSSSSYSSYSPSGPSSPSPSSSSASSPPSSSHSSRNHNQHSFRTYKAFSSHGGSRKQHQRVSASPSAAGSAAHSPARSSTRSSSRGSRGSRGATDPRATTPSLISDTETTYSGGAGGQGNYQEFHYRSYPGSQYSGHGSDVDDMDMDHHDGSLSGSHHHSHQASSPHHYQHYNQAGTSGVDAEGEYYYDNAVDNFQFDHEFLLAVKGLAPDPPAQHFGGGFGDASGGFSSEAQEWLDINDRLFIRPHHHHPMSIAWDEEMDMDA